MHNPARPPHRVVALPNQLTCMLYVCMPTQVVIDAYQRGRLIAVLPFLTKLLECCKGSKVFTPSNPMIAGILSLLAELHGMKVWAGLMLVRSYCRSAVRAAGSLLPAAL